MSKIAITDYFDSPGIEEKKVLGDLVGMEISEETEVLLVWHLPINEKTIGHLKNIKGVQRYGVGFDNLDLTYLKSRGIIACNNPAYGVDEVSDTAIAFIMAISRGILSYDAHARYHKETWQENINLSIKRVNQTKLGVVGAGRIGTSVLLKAKALGFQTLFYDPYKESGYEKVVGATRYEALNEMLNASDIISVHCPLSKETGGLIDEKFLNEMKEGASLVNTARGKLLANTDSVYEALKTGHISQVFLDVLPEEPPKQDPLIQAWRNQEDWIKGRLLINPHSSYFSQSSILDLRRGAAENALRLLKNKNPMNVLN